LTVGIKTYLTNRFRREGREGR